MDNKILRDKVKYVRAFHGITYKHLADLLGVKQKSFYSWLRAEYDFSYDRAKELSVIIQKIEKG